MNDLAMLIGHHILRRHWISWIIDNSGSIHSAWNVIRRTTLSVYELLLLLLMHDLLLLLLIRKVITSRIIRWRYDMGLWGACKMG